MTHPEAIVCAPPAPDPDEQVPIGVVLVNWNGASDTITCLRSLLTCRPAPARVVVVDNASENDSVERLRAWMAAQGLGGAAEDLRSRHDGAVRRQPWLSILESDRNRGFAGGSNLGLSVLARDTTIDHFLLLNNDARVARDYFAQLREALRVNPRAGLLSGTIYEDGIQQSVWYAGGVARLRRALMLHRNTLPQSSAPRETQFVCGCTMLLSRQVLETIGPLPECYFPGYWEDAEYSLRARARGFALLYVPAAVAHHRVGSSFGEPRLRPRVAYLQNRHRALFVRRNLRGWNRAIALSYLLVTKPARGLLEAARGRPDLGYAIVSGMIAGTLHGSGNTPQP